MASSTGLCRFIQSVGQRARTSLRGDEARYTNATRRLRVEPLEDRRLLDAAVGQQAIELFGTSPALFVENQGQWEDESIRYAFQGSGANVLLTDAGPVFQLFQHQEEKGDGGLFPSETLEPSTPAPGKSAPSPFSVAEFSVHFDGANASVPVGLERAETVHNYFVGGQSNWRTGVPTYETIVYADLYDGIDLVTWGKRTSLKYEFHVAPGADYRQIQVHYDGIDGLWLDDAGALHVQPALASEGDSPVFAAQKSGQSPWGELVDPAPYIYQELGGQQFEVAGEFALIGDDTYAFTISGPYDAGAELVIDPDLAWSTYLGGSQWEEGEGIAVDAAGNTLVTRRTGSPGWVSGGFDTSFNGGEDAFVAKLSPSGDHLWSTYLGGIGGERGYGIAVDAAGNVLVAGSTYDSPGWTSGGYDTSYGGSLDGFVVKLSPTGDHLWSTYLGEIGEDVGYGIAVDAAGNALVSGPTHSPGWVSGGFDTSYNGSGDGFVVKIGPSGDHLWSTYLGGSSGDRGGGIAVDAAGNALVMAETASAGWVSGGFDTSYNGNIDAYVAKLSPSGGHLWSTYLGGSDADDGRGIAVDAAGNALVTGYTGSTGWVSGGFDTSHNGGNDAFVAQLSPSGGHLWSTYLGGSNDEYGSGIAVDAAGNALVTGYTESPGWVSGGFDTSHNGHWDGFVARLSPTGDHLWSTYLGGSSGDRGGGIAVDAAGNAVVSGRTSSPGWVSGGFDESYNGGRDAFVARISPTPTPEVVARHVFYNNSTFDGNDPSGNAADDAAIAPDKTALLPGQTATFANYTSYSGGINGIRVDVQDLPVDVTLDADDFQFRTGNSNDLGTWTPVAVQPSVTVRRDDGTDGSARITLIWPDRVIQKEWLQVTIPAGGQIGLAQPEVFYFGNAIGECGSSPGDAKVNATDMLAARNHQRTFIDPAPIDFHYDYNRDARVNATDMLIARNNTTSFLDALELITVPGPKAAWNNAAPGQDAPTCDAVLEQAAQRNHSPAKLAWLYEFEPTGSRQRPSKSRGSAEEVVDVLLATERR